MARPSSDGLHYGSEVIVRQHHVSGLFGNIRAGDTHRDPDVSGFQSRGVIRAIAGHRHRGAAALQRLHNAQFVFRIDSRINRNFPDSLSEPLIRLLLQLGAGDGAPV